MLDLSASDATDENQVILNELFLSGLGNQPVPCDLAEMLSAVFRGFNYA